MKRKLGRLLRPGMGVYFGVMALFCATALLAEQYWLAAAETSVTLLVFVLYLTSRTRTAGRGLSPREVASRVLVADWIYCWIWRLRRLRLAI